MRGVTVAANSNGISGVAVSVIAVGGLLVWSGVQNQKLQTAFYSLMRGQKPEPGPQERTGSGNSGTGYAPISGGGNQRVVQIAASYKGHPYVFGGGHGTVCPKGGMDCSGYVSCVMNRAGLMKGTLTTDGFKSWGISVPFDQRQPGDIVVWVGGIGNGHMGIVVDGDTMWHSPCTGCGGVTQASYGKTRSGRVTIVRRPRNG